MAFKEITFQFNNGKTIDASTYGLYQLLSTYYYVVEEGCSKTPTSFSLVDFARELEARHHPDLQQEAADFLFQEQTLEAIESDLGKLYFEQFKSSIVWIWGSPEVGGCYIRTSVGNPGYFNLGIYNGLLQSVADPTKYKYAIQEASTIGVNELKNVCLMYTAVDLSGGYRLEVFYTGAKSLV